MLNYTEAQQVVLQQARSFGAETIPLEQALGRVLCETIRADRAYPPFNRAAMDGFALRYADYEKGIRQFNIAATLYAGDVPEVAIGEGRCYKIMTGAAVPADADVVVRREDAAEKNGEVNITSEDYRSFQNIARQGEDAAKDAILISEPALCTPTVISLLATIGKQQVTVQKLPTVAVITTGNEVVSINQEVSPVQIRNSNAWLLKALLAKEQVTPVSVEHIQDDKALLREAFGKVLNSDIIIASGGVSAGDADYIPAVLEELGVQKLFHKIAIRPGKPLWCGKTPAGGMVFALPGNPLSGLVNFTLFIRSYLDACYGIESRTPLLYTLKESRRKKANLDEFFPVRVIRETHMLQQLSFNGSGDIKAALFADGIALHPIDQPVLEAGTAVTYMPF